MIGREYFYMYVNFKGFFKVDVKEVVNVLMEVVGLQKYVDWVVGVYSGGNKCKLVLVIVFVRVNFLFDNFLCLFIVFCMIFNMCRIDELIYVFMVGW